MPEVKNCKRCGKLFQHGFGPLICPDCQKKEEEDFVKVKEYLYENPGATLYQVASDLEIPVERIKKYLKEGRLEISGDDEKNFILACERCGKSIKTGRHCTECERDISKDISSVSSQLGSNLEKQKQTHQKVGMRFLNRENRSN